jgi:hypothetical protein
LVEKMPNDKLTLFGYMGIAKDSEDMIGGWRLEGCFGHKGNMLNRRRKEPMKKEEECLNEKSDIWNRGLTKMQPLVGVPSMKKWYYPE